MDADAGPFISPVCQVHRDYIGGGKPPPTTVPLSRNAGDLVSTEQAAPRQQPVNQGGGEEDRTDGGRGYVGYYIEVLLGLHNTA